MKNDQRFFELVEKLEQFEGQIFFASLKIGVCLHH